jgi:hypothetical protein
MGIFVNTTIKSALLVITRDSAVVLHDSFWILASWIEQKISNHLAVQSLVEDTLKSLSALLVKLCLFRAAGKF